MTEGMVNAAYEPVTRLSVQGPSDQTGEIEAVIDAGFTVSLTVTPALAAELELDFRSTGRATLADRSEVTFPCYGVVVLWDGQPLYVEADAADTTPLVSMRPTDRHGMYVEAEVGGGVVFRARE